MKRVQFTLALSLALIGLGTQAQAVSIHVSPTSQSIGVSDTTTVDIIFDVEGDGGLNLGAFDLGISFDDSLLTLGAVTYGSGLFDGLDLGGFGEFEASDLSTPGLALLSSFSLEFDLSLQADSFILATLEFTGDAVGTSDINIVGGTFGTIDLSDDLGFPITGATTIDGEIKVTSAGPSVPDSGSTIALFGVGLAGLVLGKKRRK